MGNKKSNEQYNQSQQAYNQANAAVAQIQPTAEQKAISDDAFKDYQQLRSGDVSQNPMIAAYLQRSASARRRAQSATPMGDASLAMRIANPTLIAQNRDMLNRQSEQADAENVTDLAAQAEQAAVNRVYGYGDTVMSAAGARASGYRGLSNDAFGRYQYMKQQGSFWSNLGKGILTSAGAAFAGPVGAAAGNAVGKGIFG